jgi:hypothetical protein
MIVKREEEEEEKSKEITKCHAKAELKGEEVRKEEEEMQHK